MNQRWRLSAAVAVLAACACGVDSQADGPDNDGAGGKADDVSAIETAVCLQRAVQPNDVLARLLADTQDALHPDGSAVIANYTAWPIYEPGAASARMDSEITDRIDDPAQARKNIAARYGACAQDVGEHLQTAKPNVYIYFTGFGGADQNNSLVGQGAVLRWINERDPNALIFSINWNCAASDDDFCGKNTAALAATDDDSHVASMHRAIDVIVPQIASPELATQLKATIGGFGQQQQGYDSAHSHSMQLAAQLIDQLLVADEGEDGESLLGEIRIAGYSMGAHSAAQLLVQDFTEDASEGFEWSRRACEDGSDVCTVAGLSKVKWSLAMGLSGWSHALRDHNGLDGGEVRDPTDRAQYQNGGLFRVSNPAYAGKLAVLNRRMDPTGNSDDTFQRGFLDIFFGDYNHYSHDYDLPLFIDNGFIRVLDAFVENDGTKGVTELGIIVDNASKVDFDDCVAGGPCEAATGYIAHVQNRSHADLDEPRVAVTTTDGVAHPEKRNNLAAVLQSGDKPISLRTFDQEDLRGSVELYLRPQFDPTEAGLHGVFSYGSCDTTDAELMPQARIEDGGLVMRMVYDGQAFEASVEAASVGLAQGQWTHLAFNWELPVESLTVAHDDASELAAALPGMLPDLSKHQVALVLATGLEKPLATTYKRQQGEGTMTIFVNGQAVVEAPLGDATSARECLAAADVLSGETYEVNGQTFPEFIPYARYDRTGGDVVAFSAEQVLGTKCKAYKVRNTTAFFGCAGSDAVNIDADFDDITLVWGPGRTEFSNIDHETGAPTTWPIGVTYGPERMRL
ncbi:MAG: hypothetical protein JKY37_10735 [Nannocystaceae bacterium]|nr:hypothetical protein [Nannocystaceae bacterium]